MESFLDAHNINNSSLLINPDKNYLDKSFNILLPKKPSKIRNKRAKIENKTYNSTKDTKYNGNSNTNSSFQKTFSLFNDTSYESFSQTDKTSSIQKKEIKVKKSQNQRKNYIINNNNLSYNENTFKNIRTLNIPDLTVYKLENIIYIQKWWKYIYKIIYIQKYIRGFFVRKNMDNIICLIKYVVKILFKLMINSIKKNIKFQNKLINEINLNTDIKKNNKIRKSNKYLNKKQLNNHPLFNLSDNFNLNTKRDEFTMIGNRKIKSFKNICITNPINFYTCNNNSISINTNNNACFGNNNNKNNKKIIIKNKSDKEKEIKKITNKDKLIANNIYNIYNKVKKLYEKENNIKFQNNIIDSNYLTINNFLKKSKKELSIDNNKNIKLKKRRAKGSMKNINEKNKISNNINVSNKIIINQKRDIKKGSKNNSKKKINSLFSLLKLKKNFIFWRTYVTKKMIINKLINIKRIMAQYNIKKKLSNFTNKKEEENKSSSKKINNILNLSNSLININKNKIIPIKLKIKKENKKQITMYHNYSKKNYKNNSFNKNNNSMKNIKFRKSEFNYSFNKEKGKNLEYIENNKFSNDLFNKNIVVINQYDRNKENKNKENIKNDNRKNNNRNETKKIYYFYAIINLIDKHNKRKKIKKLFKHWKSLSKLSPSFINSIGIEEKIINFKNINFPFKNNINKNKFNRNNLLPKNYSYINYNYQTETRYDSNSGYENSNSILINKDFLINPLGKAIHTNSFQRKIKLNKIVYKKKLIKPKKMRNKSMHLFNLNDVEEYRNMTLINNNQEINFLNKSTENSFYNTKTYMNNINNLNKSQYFIKRNNFENIIMGKIKEGRLKTDNGMKEEEFNLGKINVNIIENYRKSNLKKEDKENNIWIKYIEKPKIETKQINFGKSNQNINNIIDNHLIQIDEHKN